MTEAENPAGVDVIIDFICWSVSNKPLLYMTSLTNEWIALWHIQHVIISAETTQTNMSQDERTGSMTAATNIHDCAVSSPYKCNVIYEATLPVVQTGGFDS